MERSGSLSDGPGESSPTDGQNDVAPIEVEQSDLPPLDLNEHEKELWKFLCNSDNEEVKLTVACTERWARTMQKRLLEHDPIETVWTETFTTIFGEHGIEYRLSKAVAILAKVWPHGEQLSLLHQARKQETGSDPVDDFPY